MLANSNPTLGGFILSLRYIPCPLCECWLNTQMEHGSLEVKREVVRENQTGKLAESIPPPEHSGWVGYVPMSWGRHGADAQGDANLGYRFLKDEKVVMLLLTDYFVAMLTGYNGVSFFSFFDLKKMTELDIIAAYCPVSVFFRRLQQRSAACYYSQAVRMRQHVAGLLISEGCSSSYDWRREMPREVYRCVKEPLLTLSQ